MFAICIECSHARGMGHLFRILNIAEFLQKRQEAFIVILNQDLTAIDILNERAIQFEIVNLNDYGSDWETVLIKKHGIDVWINDRMDTQWQHSQNVKKNDVRLVTFDDKGNGADLADFNIAAMSFDNKNALAGKKVLAGVQYLVLNKEIDQYRRQREFADRIIITLGGSDTYGVTIKVIEFLKLAGRGATIVLGPAFRHYEELESIINDQFIIKSNVPSLIAEFFDYDLAITGGGITPFEANACGLPSIIIANEKHEVFIGQYLANLGCSLFAGHYTDFNLAKFFYQNLPIKKMSGLGLTLFDTNGVYRIFEEIRK